MKNENRSTCINHTVSDINTFEHLPDGHVIKTLVEEHAHILSMLDELKENSDQLRNTDLIDRERSLKQINHLVVKIISAEPHHQREERVLFPALEDLGITEPPQCMVMEHEIMRKIKKDLNQMIVKDHFIPKNMIEIQDLVEKLCSILRNHIQKENTVLFPLALQMIKDDSQWSRMREECDNIGYCCFCPQTKKEYDQSVLMA